MSSVFRSHVCSGHYVFTFLSLMIHSAADKPEFMGRPPDHPWWKTGLLKSFLGCLNYFGLSSKEIFFSVINTKFACFPFNHVPIYRDLSHPSGDLWSHVGSPNQWVTFGDWATSYPQHWIHQCPSRVQCGKLGHFAMPKTCENWIGLVNIGPVNIVLIFNTENVKSVFSLVSHKCVRLHNGNTMFVF